MPPHLLPYSRKILSIEAEAKRCVAIQWSTTAHSATQDGRTWWANRVQSDRIRSLDCTLPNWHSSHFIELFICAPASSTSHSLLHSPSSSLLSSMDRHLQISDLFIFFSSLLFIYLYPHALTLAISIYCMNLLDQHYYKHQHHFLS